MGKLRAAGPLSARTDGNRWLLLMLQLPASGLNRRGQCGAGFSRSGRLHSEWRMPLPNSARAHEDFQWLRPEIEEVSWAGEHLLGERRRGDLDDDIVEQFQQAEVGRLPRPDEGSARDRAAAQPDVD